MEKIKSRSKILFRLVLILLVVFLTFFNLNVNSKKDKNYTVLIGESEKKYEELLTDFETLKTEISSLENVSDLIKTEKKDLFLNASSLEKLIQEGKSDAKIAYLTFDDGPYYNTYKVLDILKENDVKATFFTTNINGVYCHDKKDAKCQGMYKLYLKDGHTIANHTYTHAIKYGLYNSVDSFISALKKQEELVKDKTDGYVTNIVRFPGGSSQAGSLKSGIVNKLRELNYGYVDWNSQDGDGKDLSSMDQARGIFHDSINENIEVVLLHDYNFYTTSLLPEFIKYLKDNNYILLPLFYESVMVNK